MGLRREPRLSLDMEQGLRCQEPFPGQGPNQNKIRSIYLIPDCSKPISTVIYCESGSLVLHLFCFALRVPVPGSVCVCLCDKITTGMTSAGRTYTIWLICLSCSRPDQARHDANCAD